MFMRHLPLGVVSHNARKPEISSDIALPGTGNEIVAIGESAVALYSPERSSIFRAFGILPVWFFAVEHIRMCCLHRGKPLPQLTVLGGSKLKKSHIPREAVVRVPPWRGRHHIPRGARGRCAIITLVAPTTPLDHH